MGRRIAVVIDGRRQVLVGEVQQPLETPQGSQSERNEYEDSSESLPLPAPAVQPYSRTAVPHQPPSKNQQKHGCCKKRDSLEVARFVVEILTLLMLLWYTIVTQGLWNVANQANRDSTESFHLDQRAWVGITKQDQISEVKGGEEHIFYFLAVNSGKTPALYVMSRIAFAGIPKAERFVPAYTQIDKMQGIKSIGIIQPGMDMRVQTNPVLPSTEHVDAFKSGDLIFYIYGQIQYNDVFGGVHCTKHCAFLSTNLKDVHACGEYNEVSNAKCENIE